MARDLHSHTNTSAACPFRASGMRYMKYCAARARAGGSAANAQTFTTDLQPLYPGQRSPIRLPATARQHAGLRAAGGLVKLACSLQLRFTFPGDFWLQACIEAAGGGFRRLWGAGRQQLPPLLPPPGAGKACESGASATNYAAHSFLTQVLCQATKTLHLFTPRWAPRRPCRRRARSALASL